MATKLFDMISRFQQISLIAGEIFDDLMDTIKIQQTKIKITKRRIDELQKNMESMENKNASNPYNPSIFYDHPDRHDLVKNTFGNKSRRHLLKNGDLFNRTTANKYFERRRNHTKMVNAHIPLNKYLKLYREFQQKRCNPMDTHALNQPTQNPPSVFFGRAAIRFRRRRSSCDKIHDIKDKISDPNYFATQWRQDIDKRIRQIRIEAKRKDPRYRRRFRMQPRRDCMPKRYDPVMGYYGDDTDPYPYRRTANDKYYHHNNPCHISPTMFRATVVDEKRCQLIDCKRCYILRYIARKRRLQSDTKFEMSLDEQMKVVDLLINGYCGSMDRKVPMEIVNLLIAFHGGCFTDIDGYYQNEWVFECLNSFHGAEYDSFGSDEFSWGQDESD